MQSKYKRLLSPIKVGNVVLKSRLLATNAMPHFLQGPEQYPADGVISYFADIAKNGAAIVDFPDNYDTQEKRKIPIPDICRFPVMDKTDPSVDNYMSQLTEAIRFHGSIAGAAIRPPEPDGYNVVGGDLTWDENPYPRHFEEIPEDILLSTLDVVAQEAKHFRSVGFGLITMHMAYECTLSARFLTKRMNTRTDKYGGESFENRARYPMMLCEAIKKACPDMLIQLIVSGEAPNGITLDETIQLANMAEGRFDLLQIRCETCMASHPTGYNSTRGYYQTIRYAEAIKKSGAKVLVVPVGGYHNPDEMEQFLAEGKCDMFGMGRTFICDYNYYRKLQEGRGEDVVPCIRCNKCHVQNLTGPWVSICSVNPLQGMKKRFSEMIEPPKKTKRVAVIGGGPAGMEAALTAKNRGHEVVLFEKENFLGGQLFHSDYISFKWPIQDYKNWMAKQLQKNGVEIRLNTIATPAAIEAEGFDAAVLALGAVPKKLRIPGSELAYNPIEVIGHEDMLKENVVVIGGAETGAETAMYLAENGHKVTLLTRQDTLSPDCDRIHYREYMLQHWATLEEQGKAVLITGAYTNEIQTDKVIYRDADGTVHEAPCESVVTSAGMVPRQDDAIAFSNVISECYVVGDCSTVSNLQHAIRSGYAAACHI